MGYIIYIAQPYERLILERLICSQEKPVIKLFSVRSANLQMNAFSFYLFLHGIPTFLESGL